MAAGINPYLPVDPAAEGKPERMKRLNFVSFPTYAYVYKLHPVFYLIVKADTTQKPSEQVESGTGLGPDLTASVETTYSEQSSSSAGSSSSSDQPIYFRYIEKYICSVIATDPKYYPVSWYALSLGQEHLAFVFSLLLESSVSPQKFPYGWTTMGSMWPLNRWGFRHWVMSIISIVGNVWDYLEQGYSAKICKGLVTLKILPD